MKKIILVLVVMLLIIGCAPAYASSQPFRMVVIN